MTTQPSLNFNNIQMQLKARLRVPFLINSKRLNLEFDRNFKSLPSSDSNLASFTQSKMNILHMDSFNKYSLKINLLKKLLSNMTVKDLYQEEKECSNICKEVISEIEEEKGSLEFLNLPLIHSNNKLIKKKIKLKKFQSKLKPKPLRNFIYKKNIMPDYPNIPYLYSSNSNKVTSYIESTREKERERFLSTNKSKIEISPISLFNYKQNYSIIKGCGIRYNNSIFRYKSMNDLLHFERLNSKKS